jgi:hypothetical protein
MSSNSAEIDEFLRAIKIRSLTSFGGEVKPLVPCCKIPWGMIGTDRQNSAAFPHPVSPHLVSGCLLQPELRTLVDKSRIIRTQMGSTVSQKMVAVAWNALDDTTS